MSVDTDSGGTSPPADDAADETNRTDERDPTAEIQRVAERGRRRLDHATATVDQVLDHCDDAADDAALRRARKALRNAVGDFEELEAVASAGEECEEQAQCE